MLNCRTENAPYGHIILNNDGVIRDVNETFSRLLGYGYDELVHRNLESFLSIASKIMFHSLFFSQLQLKGSVEEVILTIRTKSGLDIPVMIMGHFDNHSDEEVISCIVVKMTKRYDYEQELRHIKTELEEAYKSKKIALKKESKLRKLLETTLFSICEGIIVTDASGHITLMNPLAECYTAWSNQDASGEDVENILTFIDLKTKNPISNPCRAVLSSGASLNFPDIIVLVARDGSERFISGNASAIFSDDKEITGAVITLRDITKQYLQEKEIDSFLNVNLDMLCVADLDANFHKVNQMFEEVLGYSSEELVGQSYLSFIHEDDIESTLEATKDLANDKKVSGFVNRYRCKDGSYKYIEWQAQHGVGNFTYSSARDITEKKRLEEERLKISEEKYRFVAENVFDVVWILNFSKKVYTYISPSILQQTGFTVEESMKQQLEDTFPSNSLATIQGAISKAVKYLKKHPDSSYRTVTELQKRCKSGEVIWIEATTNIFINDQGDIEIVGTSRNIEERKQMEAFRHLSYHDQLTGLYNRQFFNSIIDDEMIRSDRYNQKLSMCIMDLDLFKKVNDTWGHPIGDELLRHTAEIALSHKRNSDLVFRFGGEEFVILLPGTKLNGAVSVLEKIRQAIEHNSHPVTGRQTVSVGVAEKLEHESFFDWYKRADEALYQAKHSGRNCVIAFDE